MTCQKKVEESDMSKKKFQAKSLRTKSGSHAACNDYIKRMKVLRTREQSHTGNRDQKLFIKIKSLNLEEFLSFLFFAS